MCYGACASGFHFCRPVLGLDGTHLKSKYQGILLAATGVDAAGALFPLAYAVVNAENDTTGSGLSDNCTRLSKLMLSRTLSLGFSPFSLIVRRDSSRVLRQCFHIVPTGIASIIFGTTCIRNSRTKISANTFGKPHMHSPSMTLIMHSKKWRILTSVQFIGFSRLYQQSIGQSCTS